MFGFSRKNKDEAGRQKVWRDGVFLTSAKDSFEADIFISKLAGEGIPAEKRYQGNSNMLEIYMGMSTISPVDIYVPADALEEAKEIIKPVPIEDDFVEAEEDENEDD
ncbi:MAG: DUF2007 domain-containing protein [Anaerovoracaceae bacterium]|nr:DUF2007 domain-containing protein [Bacillota bacterium]MDY2670181.1 DUF2007 domain-containing protein [Anaerovoracaceae bacterium]